MHGTLISIIQWRERICIFYSVLLMSCQNYRIKKNTTNMLIPYLLCFKQIQALKSFTKADLVAWFAGHQGQKSKKLSIHVSTAYPVGLSLTINDFLDIYLVCRRSAMKLFCVRCKTYLNFYYRKFLKPTFLII